MKNIIFVGGIHGVGKTSFAKKLCHDFELVHITASDLIGVLKEGNHVNDIFGNQKILIEAINNLNNVCSYLLDGHFCLLGANNKIQVVEVDVFEKLQLKGIVVLWGKVATIQERIYKRDGSQYTLDFLSSFQEKELEQAELVSDSLNLPLRVISSSNQNDETIGKNFIESLLT